MLATKPHAADDGRNSERTRAANNVVELLACVASAYVSIRQHTSAYVVELLACVALLSLGTRIAFDFFSVARVAEEHQLLHLQ